MTEYKFIVTIQHDNEDQWMEDLLEMSEHEACSVFAKTLEQQFRDELFYIAKVESLNWKQGELFCDD